MLIGASSEPVGVWPANWDAVRLFSWSCTQWRRNPLTGALEGLDYAGVRAAAEMLGIPMTPGLFESLGRMELEAMRRSDAG